MPTFGAYETFGEPISITEERGEVTVWKARNTESKDGRVYATNPVLISRLSLPLDADRRLGSLPHKHRLDFS